MTTGKKTSRGECVMQRLIGLLIAMLIALPVLLVPALAHALDVDGLMTLLAQRKGGEARFTEERTVSGLDAPLRASGLLTFQAPDRFARFTQQPRAESMEVDGNTVLLKRGGRSRQISLDSVPELAALADALRGTLNGDSRTLRKHFQIDVTGTESRWKLTLVPSDARLRANVQSLEIGGQQADVRVIDLRMVGGDRSVMQVEPLTSVPATPAAPTQRNGS